MRVWCSLTNTSGFQANQAGEGDGDSLHAGRVSTLENDLGMFVGCNKRAGNPLYSGQGRRQRNAVCQP